MSDIVNRLRPRQCEPYPWRTMAEAADEIERLRAESQKLREALEEAMRLRHFLAMESDPDSSEDKQDTPYQYDEYLRRWASVLGVRVYSYWPQVNDGS